LSGNAAERHRILSRKTAEPPREHGGIVLIQRLSALGCEPFMFGQRSD
jgi:hypothetical protein